MNSIESGVKNMRKRITQLHIRPLFIWVTSYD